MLTTISADRFSGLPDNLAYHIFSFLKLKDITRLSLVSKRFKRLCMSTPFLAFDDTNCRFDEAKRAQMMNYIDRFLFLRKGTHIHRLYIRWYLRKGTIGDEYRVVSWLHNAVLCNVKHIMLDLVVEVESEFTLPTSLLSCASLEALTVRLDDDIFKLPNSISTMSGSIFLKSLTLQSVKLDDNFGISVSTCCKFLKELRLRDIKGVKCIVITSSSLELLAILKPHHLVHLLVCAEMLRSVVVEWRFDSHETRLLHLSTPSLETLLWKGNKVNFSSAGRFDNLAKVGIFLRPYTGVDFITQPQIDTVLQAVCSTKCLALLDINIQDCLQTMFPSLMKLHIEVSAAFDVDLVRNMASLFRVTPNLHHLSIKREFEFRYIDNASDQGKDGEDAGICDAWYAASLPFLHDVTMELIRQDKYELELIKYLFKYAGCLRTIAIFYVPPLKSHFNREVIGCKKASILVQLKFIRCGA
ncbi:hypothetical protein TIFTF001_033376 [Ficus carica]|uniref:F-box domain-containing protein n=1 Tax=Ficus carica TaxID=3494 RepID=A0AA88E579_FICCA|nr:hypothetical protein TIFTF001_033376 [Ficus carica]